MTLYKVKPIIWTSRLLLYKVCGRHSRNKIIHVHTLRAFLEIKSESQRNFAAKTVLGQDMLSIKVAAASSLTLFVTSLPVGLTRVSTQKNQMGGTN